MLCTDDFFFDLPPDRIAAHPLPRRSDAKLMVLDRATRSWTHSEVSQLPTFGETGDLWVLNDSRVIRARLLSEGIEIMLIEETSPKHWLCLTRPGKKTKPGDRIQIPCRQGSGEVIGAEILRTLPSGERVVRFDKNPDLERFGQLPLPPYIEQRRRQAGENPESPEDNERYQTIYAAKPGSVAAPTAGLHLTPEMLSVLDTACVTLHVGIGTFRPVKTPRLADHVMHAERYQVEEGVAAQLTAARRRIAVGTTSTRVLESLAQLAPAQGQTDIFIRPPYRFRHTDLLLTNFHLPKSTLLMLVAAFVGHPWPDPSEKACREALQFLLAAYDEAIRAGYRFFSYGDAMLIR